MKFRQFWPLMLVLLLAACGVHSSRSAAANSLASDNLTLKPVIRNGLTWVHHRTALPLYAPTKIPGVEKTQLNGYGFATKTAYGITVLSFVQKRVRFNAPSLASGKTGHVVTSYSLIRPTGAPDLTVWTLLASYNLMGPNGLPKLTGTRAVLAPRVMAHWSSDEHLLWWRKHGWLFLVEAASRHDALAAAKELAAGGGLPRGPGLFVAAPGALAADWEFHGLIATVDGDKAPPGQVLAMVKSFRLVPLKALRAKG